MSDPISPALRERDVYSVSRLNREAKVLLEGSFPLLWVEGEISNLSRPASGHLYFSLKDSQAQVRCALFRGNQRGMAVRPRDGMLVLVRARVSLYEGRGDYQLIVETLEEAGEGALRRAFELLKNRLAREGLFDPSHKQPLPRLPRCIGVITSPSGAVMHDILTTLARRFPAIPVLLHPVPVQGEGAAEKIAAIIQLAGERQDCDVLILARGGGSLEDLWAFNEEIVARAIHACPIPIVCGVGHETDFTIADFVADARAPTPTAAAEMLSPNQSDWLDALARHQRHLKQLVRNLLRERQQQIDYLGSRLVHPQSRLFQLQTRTDTLDLQLQRAMSQRLNHIRQSLRIQVTQLRALNPQSRVREHRLQLVHRHAQLAERWQQRMTHARDHLRHVTQLLDTLSPLATLTRGYAIVERDGVVLRDAGTIRIGDRVRTRLARGVLDCRVESKSDEG